MAMIPIIDLSPFLEEHGDNNEKEKQVMIDMIHDACSDYGFFQIVNHGIPLDIITRALHLSKLFFQHPLQEKLKSSPKPGSPLPAGYGQQAQQSPDKNEFLLMFPPGSTFNVYPTDPPQFRETLDETFSYLVKLGRMVETILNECLGLPPNLLSEYNDDRKEDLMSTFRYFPATTETENTGVPPHKDVNFITFVFQDEVGGLEVLKDGDWIPVKPMEGTLVVNVGDVIQVLSNEKYKSVTHRVVRTQGKERYSYAFFYNLGGEKWVEPLPQFTDEIKESPKYRGFLYKEYLQLRLRNKTHPPSNPEDIISIKHYAITTPHETETHTLVLGDACNHQL